MSLIGVLLTFASVTCGQPINGTYSQSGSGVYVFNPSPKVYFGFVWSSIGLAVLTGFLQGLVTTLATMTESSNYWTFRFRLAKTEHWWWTLVSVLLFSSLVLIMLSFAAGNTNESISILVLSSTTLLAIVRYMLPSWRSRRYIQNRYLAWTGPSRTAINRNLMAHCGGSKDWKRLCKEIEFGERKTFPSDYYGWHIKPIDGIREDPTEILKNKSSRTMTNVSEEGTVRYIYNDGNGRSDAVSLFWGTHNGFLPRVSRSISSIPAGLLKSQPFTNDGYAGEGFCLGMGILGRNKGLRPGELVFHMTKDISTVLENTSTWKPRPSKTLRSYYQTVLSGMYHGLGTPFVNAAVELCLILMDADEPAIKKWLIDGREQQDYTINEHLQKLDAKEAELAAHYESSYVSMILSLNYIKDDKLGRTNHRNSKTIRPDIICLALLLKKRGSHEPEWWQDIQIKSWLYEEKESLNPDFKGPAAKMLGLDSFPHGLEDGFWDGQGEPKIAIINRVTTKTDEEEIFPK